MKLYLKKRKGQKKLFTRVQYFEEKKQDTNDSKDKIIL